MLYVLATIGAVAIILAIFYLRIRFSRRATRTRAEVATLIEDFLEDRESDGSVDWDTFTHVPIADPQLESIRWRCFLISTEPLPKESGEIVSEEGRSELREYVRMLRAPAA